jgi:hypothetical protein
LWATVALTLALGIGANTAIFSVVRGVLLRPLVNRDEDRLIYMQQSAPGLQVDNASFSIPEITDIGAHLKTISKLGTFSTVDFTTEGFGEAREIHAAVVVGEKQSNISLPWFTFSLACEREGAICRTSSRRLDTAPPRLPGSRSRRPARVPPQ